MDQLEDQAFSWFGTSRPCALCGIPLVVCQDLASMVWTLVHGEQPVMCWKDESLGDELDTRQFRRDFALAVAYTHWH
jgi:hypothetical protein